MPTLRVPTEEGIRATARQGEDAVVAMVSELLQVVALLAKRVQELEDKQAKNSNNSSKPPSSDGMSNRNHFARLAGQMQPAASAA